MGKKMVYLLFLFVIINSLIGCATTRIYKSNGIRAFEKDIRLAYPNIDKIEVRRVDVAVRVTIWLKEPVTKAEVEEMFKAIEEYINADNFVNAITKEDKAKGKSFSRASISVVNPDAHKSKESLYINYTVDLK